MSSAPSSPIVKEADNLAPFEIGYASDDDDIILVHRFLCVIAAPVLLAPIDALKSVTEINRLVHEPGAGFVLMAIADDTIIGTLGIVVADWWYGNDSFLTDRFFFVIDRFKNTGAGAALEAEAAQVAKEMKLNLIINGKMRRRGDVFYTLPRTHHE